MPSVEGGKEGRDKVRARSLALECPARGTGVESCEKEKECEKQGLASMGSLGAAEVCRETLMRKWLSGVGVRGGAQGARHKRKRQGKCGGGRVTAAEVSNGTCVLHGGVHWTAAPLLRPKVAGGASLKKDSMVAGGKGQAGKPHGNKGGHGRCRQQQSKL